MITSPMLLLALAALPALQSAPQAQSTRTDPVARPPAEAGETRAREPLQEPREQEPRAARGWLGVTLELKTDPEGEQRLEIVEVQRGSPAERAGLRRGDVLHSLDRRSVRDHESLERALADQAPGDSVEVAVHRKLQVEVQTQARASRGQQPEPRPQDRQPEPDRQEPPRMGVSIEPEASGLRVSGVESGWGAERGGIRAGDTVVNVDGRKVATVEEVRQMLASKQPGSSVEVTILRRENVRMGRAPGSPQGGADQESPEQDGTWRSRDPDPSRTRESNPLASQPRDPRAVQEAQASRERETELRQELSTLRNELHTLRNELSTLRDELRQLRRDLQQARER